jgi:hypothetical protein
MASWRLRTDSVRLNGTDRSVLGQLCTRYNVGTIRDLTDGQLLERFATEKDEVAELAFAALVERHEAMVWRVCLAIVRNEHEAEDAFLVKYTKDKTIKELESEVEKARSDELEEHATWELEKGKEMNLERELRLKRN